LIALSEDWNFIRIRFFVKHFFSLNQKKALVSADGNDTEFPQRYFDIAIKKDERA
jgi:hypothetical protein